MKPILERGAGIEECPYIGGKVDVPLQTERNDQGLLDGKTAIPNDITPDKLSRCFFRRVKYRPGSREKVPVNGIR